MTIITVLLCACAFIVLPIAVINGRDVRSVSIDKNVDVMLPVGKLMIDTDAGGDDATGILLTLGHQALHGQVEVVGITCVVGNTAVNNVVVNVFKTLATVNRLDIPVYRGARNAIHMTPESDNFFGEDGFGDFEYPNPPDSETLVQKKHAVQALIDIAANNPGEVTVLCLGPLTNIALAIRLDPMFLSNIQQLVVIGGSVEGFGNVKPGIEFNFFADPEAAFIVFNSTDTSVENVNPVVLLPWESVVNRNIITLDWRLNVLGTLTSPQMLLLNQAESAILQGEVWASADAMITAIAINASIIVTTTTQYVQVEAQGAWAGAVFVDYSDALGQPSNAVIVQAYDVDAFKIMLLACLSHDSHSGA